MKSNRSNGRSPMRVCSGCNYANDRSFSDLYPSLSLYGWRLATVTARFLFSCTLRFGDSRRPGSKNAEGLICWKDSLTFRAAPPPSLSIFVVCVCVSAKATFSLFLYRSLCSHFFSLSTCLSFSIYPSGFHQIFSHGSVLEQTNISVMVDASFLDGSETSLK